MIGRLVNEQLKASPDFNIWGNMLPQLKANDFNLINLEAALTFSEEKVPKVFNFKSDPEHVQTLINGKIDMVNLANNHILDYSEKGLLETLAALEKASIPYLGAGRTWEQAIKPAIVERKGLKIGVLGATDNEPGWRAEADRPGTFYLKVGGINPLIEQILKLRPQVDLLIITLHWGPNMVQRPPKEFQEFAHQLLDAGADLIHGHSAHIFQGVEIYKERKIIFYDTGDFVDDYAVDSYLRNDQSFLFTVQGTKRGFTQITLFPTLISSFQVNRAKPQEAEEQMERMCVLSKELGTSFKKENNTLTFLLNY